MTDYLSILYGELGIQAHEAPSTEGEELLDLIIAEIIRNAMFSLFCLEREEKEPLRSYSTNSLHHFVRKKSRAILSGSGFEENRIEDRINVLLKHKDTPKDNRFDANLFDMGEILHIGGTKPILPTPIRAIVGGGLDRPILACSWPTKILREQGMDVQFKGISRTISKSDIAVFKLPTQTLTEFVAPPTLVLESYRFDNSKARIMHVLKGLGRPREFIEWREERIEDDRTIDIVRKEILQIKYLSVSDPFGVIKGPMNELPVQDSSNRRRFWAIFRTQSKWRESDFWLFTTGKGNQWDGGHVREIPGGMVRYLLRLLSGPKRIEVISQDGENPKINLYGVPPTSGRRLLHLLGSKDVTDRDDLRKGKLVYSVPEIHLEDLVRNLCDYFFYSTEEE